MRFDPRWEEAPLWDEARSTRGGEALMAYQSRPATRGRSVVVAAHSIGGNMPSEEHVAAAAEDYRDTQDWQVRVQEFRRWHKFYRFTVDGCADKHGRNRQLETFWHDCMKQDFRGQRIWFNPPFNAGKDGVQVSDIIERFHKAREEDPRTAACFLLPYLPGAEWEAALQRLEGAECVFTYPTGTHLFYAQDGGNPPTKWPVQVWWCPPLREAALLATGQEKSNLRQEEAMAATQSKEPAVPQRRSKRLVQPTAAPQGYEERLHEQQPMPPDEPPEVVAAAVASRVVAAAIVRGTWKTPALEARIHPKVLL